MTGTRFRLAAVYRGLTARERARLAVQAWKDEEQEEPLVRDSMPFDQFDQFWGIIDQVRAVQRTVVPYLLLVQAQMDRVDAESNTLRLMTAWAYDMGVLGAYLAFCTPEPITEAALALAREEESRELAPAAHFAEMLALHEGDIEAMTDRQLMQRRRDHERRLAEAVAKGNVRGRKRRGGLLIETGSFHAWRGEEVPVFPKWASRLEVRGDRETEEVERELACREQVRRAVLRAPHSLVSDCRLGEGNVADQVAEVLRARVADSLPSLYGALLAIDASLEPCLRELDGDDPLHPGARRLLEDVRQRCVAAAEELDMLRVAVTLPEVPDAVVMEQLTANMEAELR